MSGANTASDAIRASVDRLYWNSEESVDAVASRLGLSRHALYQAVHPHPAGAACGICGGELAFANRSQRTRRRARCTECGGTCTLSATDGETRMDEGPRAERWSAGAWRAGPGRKTRLGAAAVLGLAVAVAAVEGVRARG
jgi:hypothetical protein